jgi:hypothetical protein
MINENSLETAIEEEKVKQTITKGTEFINESKTLTISRGLKPERKKTDIDTYSSRILIVCPYSQFNEFFPARIPDFVQGAYFDIVNSAEQNKPPYINIKEREKGQPLPFWIIDFGKIMIEGPTPKDIANARLRLIKTFISNYTQNLGETSDLYSILLSDKLKEKDFVNLISKISRGLKRDLEGKLNLENIGKTDEETKETNQATRTYKFHEYQNWAKSKITIYLKPKKSILDSLESQEQYDSEGNFIPSSVSVKMYMDIIMLDFRGIKNGQKRCFSFFMDI